MCFDIYLIINQYWQCKKIDTNFSPSKNDMLYFVKSHVITLCIRETPKRVLLQTVKIQMK